MTMVLITHGKVFLYFTCYTHFFLLMTSAF